MDFVQDVTPEVVSARYGARADANAGGAVAGTGASGGGGGGGGERKSARARKISKALRRVDAAARAEAAAARLNSFESDVAFVPGTAGEAHESDDEFTVNENARDGEAVIVKGKKKAGKRATRGVVENRRAAAARTFNALLEQSFIDRAPSDVPTYLTAAAGPSTSSAPRKFCSVCGFVAPYGCARCGMRFCSKKCSAVHAETRCLKMVG